MTSRWRVAARAVPRADIRPNSSFSRVPLQSAGEGERQRRAHDVRREQPADEHGHALVGEPLDSRASNTR